MRRRSRSRGDGLSRRRFLAGGLLAVGGASLLEGTRAFSQVDATRAASVDSADDQSALLAVDPAASVTEGESGATLVTLTNNTDGAMTVAVSLHDPGQGSVVEGPVQVASGAQTTFTVDVASDATTGTDAMGFEVTATGQDVSIELDRAVDVVAGPTLKQRIDDRTRNNNAAYTIFYRVRNVGNFDRIEVDVENLDAGHIGTTSYVRNGLEGSLEYPPGGGSDGGAQGDTYEFRYRVYDANGRVSQLDETVTDVADGDDPPGDDLGGDPNDPSLVGFTVENDEQWTNNHFTVDYEVDETSEFSNVRVLFDNQAQDWADQTHTSTAAPTGTVHYPDDNPGADQGGVNGDTYQVTVEVINENGVLVDDGTVTITAGSEDTVSWP